MGLNNLSNTSGTALLTKMVPKAKRRRFSAGYRLRLLEEADACVKPGEVGALLRQESIYIISSGSVAQAA